jgi:hypothetical protein
MISIIACNIPRRPILVCLKPLDDENGGVKEKIMFG